MKSRKKNDRKKSPSRRRSASAGKSIMRKVSARPKAVKNAPKKTEKKSKAPLVKAPKVKAPTKKELRIEMEKAQEEQRKEMAKKLMIENSAKVGTILTNSHIRQILIQVGGENALSIIRSFYGNQSDDELAKKLKLKISDVRATLNRLHNEGLVNYVREKDNDTGWYSYSWSLNMIRIEKWVGEQNSRLGEAGISGANLYFCPTCGASTIVDFNSATDMLFRCERCNKMLEYLDEKRVAELYERKV